MTNRDDAVDYTQRDPAFFAERDRSTRAAAEAVVPMLIEACAPRSVIDLGCGVGTWLAVFMQHGVPDVRGIDGGAVGPDLLQIPADRFEQRDLSRPIEPGRGFDLALSLEVAEHLPPEAAEPFVATLVRLAPVVLFSAAIPNQGGISHVNERPQSYWAERFAVHDYVAIDVIRRRIWGREDIKAWYRQNLLLFARCDRLASSPMLRDWLGQTRPDQLDLVHPQTLQWRVDRLRDDLRRARDLYLGDVLRMLPRLARRALVNRVGRLLAPRRRGGA